jgi:hypothetical protein
MGNCDRRKPRDELLNIGMTGWLDVRSIIGEWVDGCMIMTVDG